jgi:hypothetical protein
MKWKFCTTIEKRKKLFVLKFDGLQNHHWGTLLQKSKKYVNKNIKCNILVVL